MNIEMTPNRSYITRALYEWIVDNDCTPYLIVNALAPRVIVPQEHVTDGQIVLNIEPSAVQGLLIDTDGVSFNARFGGVPQSIFVPVWAIMGIVAKETNQGAYFDPNEIEVPNDEPEPPKPKPPTDRPTKRPSLKVVK